MLLDPLDQRHAGNEDSSKGKPDESGDSCAQVSDKKVIPEPKKKLINPIPTPTHRGLPQQESSTFEVVKLHDQTEEPRNHEPIARLDSNDAIANGIFDISIIKEMNLEKIYADIHIQSNDEEIW